MRWAARRPQGANVGNIVVSHVRLTPTENSTVRHAPHASHAMPYAAVRTCWGSDAVAATAGTPSAAAGTGDGWDQIESILVKAQHSQTQFRTAIDRKKTRAVPRLAHLSRAAIAAKFGAGAPQQVLRNAAPRINCESTASGRSPSVTAGNIRLRIAKVFWP